MYKVLKKGDEYAKELGEYKGGWPSIKYHFKAYRWVLRINIEKALCTIGIHNYGEAQQIPFPEGWKYKREDWYWVLAEQRCKRCKHVKTYQTL